jgi:hypothetical protein
MLRPPCYRVDGCDFGTEVNRNALGLSVIRNAVARPALETLSADPSDLRGSAKAGSFPDPKAAAREGNKFADRPVIDAVKW